jgi:UDP-glucose:(heptosyl)LPS alpha-1,3-glucosyltransferase
VISFGRLLRQDILRSGGGTHRGFLKRLAQQGGIRRQIWQRLSVYHRSLLALEKRQFAPANSRAIIAVSEQVKRDIVCNYAVPPEKIIVLYNGVDTERFHPDKSRKVREQVRNRWRIPSDAPLVLFVGSGFRRKGLDSLLALWESPSLKSVYLLVVGADARLSRYRARANAIAAGRMVFTGRQDDIENYYAAADVVALLSIQEAFGNVLLEALASGLPVLVTRNVGACEIVQGPFREGVIDVTDPREVQADKLLALLKSSRQPEIRRRARTLAEAYSWGKHFARLEGLLMETLPISRGGSDSVSN